METTPKWMKRVRRARIIRRVITALAALVIIGAIVGSFSLYYTHEETVTARVVSINGRLDISNDEEGVAYTSTTYFVSTDKGVFRIEPVGLMASSAFGMLEKGKTYRMRVRGIRYETTGSLPYIIEAEEVE